MKKHTTLHCHILRSTTRLKSLEMLHNLSALGEMSVQNLSEKTFCCLLRVSGYISVYCCGHCFALSGVIMGGHAKPTLTKAGLGIFTSWASFFSLPSPVSRPNRLVIIRLYEASWSYKQHFWLLMLWNVKNSTFVYQYFSALKRTSPPDHLLWLYPRPYWGTSIPF